MYYLMAGLLAVTGTWFYASIYPIDATQRLIKTARFVCRVRVGRVEVDGYLWHYLDSDSNSAKPVVLLIHGYGADKDSWLGYARLLTRHYRVIAPDLPGFGDNDRGHFDSYAPRLQAQRLNAFCQAIGIQETHVCGSSMGGFISCWFAVDHASRVASLTLMNAAGVFGENASVVQTEAEAGRNILMVTNVADFSRLLRMLSPKLVFVPAFIKRYAVATYQAHATMLEQVFWELAEAQQNDGLQERLPEIAAPVLIIWGDRDAIIDVSCAAVFADAIPDSTVLILPGSGHIPMFEAPRTAARCQRKLIDRVLSA